MFKIDSWVYFGDSYDMGGLGVVVVVFFLIWIKLVLVEVNYDVKLGEVEV